jgi:hypothetical protein
LAGVGKGPGKAFPVLAKAAGTGVLSDRKDREDTPMATATQESAEEIKRRIGELNLEHRDLDRAIEALEHNPLHDELQLKRLKKRKLMLKDQIFMLQRQLVPDIPA